MLTCRCLATGFDGVAQREPGDVFLMPDEAAYGSHSWFEIIEEPAKAADAQAAAPQVEDELPV